MRMPPDQGWGEPVEPMEPIACQIRVSGHLDRRWSDWLGGLAITLAENGDTLLTGTVADQAALHGVLRKLRDLALPLVSVVCSTLGQAEVPHGTGR